MENICLDDKKRHSGCTCCHHHQHSQKPWYKQSNLYKVLIGISSFALSYINASIANYCLFIAALILGGEVYFTAVRNFFRGHMFDENLLMTIASGGAFYLGDYHEAIGIVMFYQIGEFFEGLATTKSQQKVKQMLDMRVKNIKVQQPDGTFSLLPSEKVTPQAIVLVATGERIPLDGTVHAGTGSLDTSSLTGESFPLEVKPGDKVLSGMLNCGAPLQIYVEKNLADSMVSKLVQITEVAAAQKPHLEKFITKFARYYTPFIVLAAILATIFPHPDQWKAQLPIALTFLIISCPCALVISIPLSFFTGIGRAAKRGIFFKNSAILEGLHSIKAVAFDKTGTLTEGHFNVQAVQAENEMEFWRYLASLEKYSNHPLAKAILTAYAPISNDFLNLSNVKEVSGYGIQGEYRGKQVICGRADFLAQKNIATPTVNSPYTAIFLAIDDKYYGHILLGDNLRPGSKELITELAQKGLHFTLLTGDRPEPAHAIAKQLGINDVSAGLLPAEKLIKLKKLRQTYGPILFVGDGINDAPVLANADIGIAMGEGADSATEAADIVLLKNTVQHIALSWQISDQTRYLAYENIVLALGIKIIIIGLSLAGYTSLWGAVFADTGATLLCIANALRGFYK